MNQHKIPHYLNKHMKFIKMKHRNHMKQKFVSLANFVNMRRKNIPDLKFSLRETSISPYGIRKCTVGLKLQRKKHGKNDS